ncbi:MAG: NTP transferase domain-containing protein [Alphaproteobacteria bacterium]|jgi:mannose-1-phosphate guanylyltransferase/mannose-6-phosphate isomerase|nr:NTP transferase domain-containing protein [Alphaproteobacteria bacterium]
MGLSPVILAGGRGSRLWPLSRPLAPKPFLPLGPGGRSLLQDTAARALALTGRVPVVLTTADLADRTRAHLGPGAQVVAEPVGRNTGAAIALAARRAPEEAILWVMPADHAVGDAAPLRGALDTAQSAARARFIALVGIEPRWPSPHFGYIRRGHALPDAPGAFRVAAFAEKPDRDRARAYIAQGGHLWNAGMVVVAAGTLRAAFAAHAPAYWAPVDYAALAPAPFDRLVLEQAENVAVVPCALTWRDVGTWGAVLATLRDRLTA